MTTAQETLVQTSFVKVASIADAAAILFYDDLFERDPSLRPLFKEDMTEQRRKLMSMLTTAVVHIDNWDHIAGAVRALGQRHVAYGVQPAHYETVGAALLATLEKGLGDDFTPDVRAAWQACIAKVATEMLSATAPA
jgi:hemoglobin-like flavoprotein